MSEFNRDMLPCLGVMWHYFDSFENAQAFAQWAENVTSNDEYPCEAFVTVDDDVFEVKVRNW